MLFWQNNSHFHPFKDRKFIQATNYWSIYLLICEIGMVMDYAVTCDPQDVKG